MGFKGLMKKAVILCLLLVVMAAVFLIKNDKAREGLFGRMEPFISRALFLNNRGADNSEEISVSEINMDSLINKEEPVPEDLAENTSEGVADSVVEDEPSLMRGPESKPSLTLDNNVDLEAIAKKVNEIQQQVQRLGEEVEVFVTLNNLNKQIAEISKEIESMVGQVDEVAYSSTDNILISSI